MPEIFELGPECHETYFCGEHFPALASLGVPIAGLSALRGHYRVEHCMGRHAVVITLEGHGHGAAGDWQGSLRPGAVLCVPAHTRLALHTEGDAAWATAWAHLEPRRWPRFPGVAELRENVGAAPVTALRMQLAAYGLTATSVPLKVVADRLGHASPCPFSTAFKRYAGVAPAPYREEHRAAA